MGRLIPARDLARLPEIQSVLLDPLSHADYGDWCREVMRAWGEVLGSDLLFMAIPSAEGMNGVPSVSELEGANAQYQEYFWKVDPVLGREWVERGGPPVHHRDDWYDRKRISEDELYQDWCTPWRLHDALGVGLDVGGPIPAMLHAYRSDGNGASKLRAKRVLAELIAPSFRAGASAWLRLREVGTELGRLLDGLSDGVVLFGSDGLEIHRNPPARRLLNRADIGSELASRARQLALACGGLQGGKPAARTTDRIGPVGLTVVRFHRGDRGGRTLCAVIFSDESVVLPNPQAVHRQLPLTPRQAEVAVLLARRKSDKEVARLLGIRPATARRHRDAILARLGLHSRRDVAAALRERCLDPKG